MSDMKIRSFEDIVAWQKTRLLTKRIYEVSGRGDFGRDFALQNQIRKSAVSIAANIAEGFARKGDREFARFLAIASGSAAETKSHLYIARDQNYISEKELKDLYNGLDEIARLIHGLERYLRQGNASASTGQTASGDRLRLTTVD